MTAARHTSLRTRLTDGDQLVGALLRMPAEELLEMVAVAGFDFLVVDCEHGPADLTVLRQHLAFAAARGVPVLVRVGSHEPALVLRVLDQGAAGVIAPHIDTVDDAAALVASAHYPPLGQRGFATYSRAGDFGLLDADEHRRRQQVETMVLGMIESPLGVSNARDILSVRGLDGTMIGTADLRASSTTGDPPWQDSVETVHRVVAELGALRMDIVATREHAVRSLRDGAQLVVYNLTAVLMSSLAELRGVR